MSDPPIDDDPGRRGRWLVLALVGGGMLLAIIALFFREFTPATRPSVTTAPARDAFE